MRESLLRQTLSLIQKNCEWGEMKMLRVSATIKQKKLEKVYKSHANEIYKVCLHYLKNERKAQDVTERVFLEYYEKFEEVDSKHIFAYLVQQAKRLSTNEEVHEYANGEVTQ